MNRKQLSTLLLFLDKWSRRNKEKIKHPVRAKHFLQDLSYFLHWLDDEEVHGKIQKWRNESIPKSIKKIFGIR